METVTRFSVSMSEGLLGELDSWIAQKGLPNRSEALRQLIRGFVSESRWETGEGEVCGSLTITYDHHSHDAAHEMTHLQHDFGDVIVCVTHAHINADCCLEVIVLRGNADRVREFVDAMRRIKGIATATPCITSMV